jgi:hypothetical protein
MPLPPPRAERHCRTAKERQEAQLTLHHARFASNRRYARSTRTRPFFLLMLVFSVWPHPSTAGFCAVSDTLPMPWVVQTDTKLTSSKSDNGLNVTFGQEIHCVVAEPHSVFLRVGVVDGGQEAAFELAVLGRLRGGFRVFQLRGMLGTRIELNFLFVCIRFGSKVVNLWPTPRQVLHAGISILLQPSSHSRSMFCDLRAAGAAPARIRHVGLGGARAGDHEAQGGEPKAPRIPGFRSASLMGCIEPGLTTDSVVCTVIRVHTSHIHGVLKLGRWVRSSTDAACTATGWCVTGVLAFGCFQTEAWSSWSCMSACHAARGHKPRSQHTNPRA